MAEASLVKLLRPHSRPKRIPWSYPSLRTPTPFSRILDEKKTPPFQPKLPILRPNKTTRFKQNAFFCSLYKIKHPFCESENKCIKLKTFFYISRIFYYITWSSNPFVYDKSNMRTNKEKYIHAKFCPFQNFCKTFVQVMAWCRQAISHYLSQCLPIFVSAHGIKGHNELILFTYLRSVPGVNVVAL